MEGGAAGGYDGEYGGYETLGGRLGLTDGLGGIEIDGDGLGTGLGETDGDMDGETDGEGLGEMAGDTVGETDGETDLEAYMETLLAPNTPEI